MNVVLYVLWFVSGAWFGLEAFACMGYTFENRYSLNQRFQTLGHWTLILWFTFPASHLPQNLLINFSSTDPIFSYHFWYFCTKTRPFKWLLSSYSFRFSMITSMVTYCIFVHIINSYFSNIPTEVTKACDWLIAHRHDDGGWGENFESCEQKEYVPAETSQVVNTAWALLGLMAVRWELDGCFS